LKLVEGLSHSEIAARLGLSEGGSKSNWSKAKRKLKMLFSEQRQEPDDVA
jgi:DNA-directed RNA polymerase specialized sigma24 family protein